MLRYWKQNCLLPAFCCCCCYGGFGLLCMLFDFYSFFCFVRSLSSLRPSSRVSSLPNPHVFHLYVFENLFLPSCAGLTFVEASSVLLAYCLDSRHLLDWTCFPDFTACWYQLCLIDGYNFLAVSCASESSLTNADRPLDWRIYLQEKQLTPVGRNAEITGDEDRTAWGYSNPAAQIAQFIDQFQCLDASLLPPKGWIEPNYHDNIIL